MLWFHSKSIMYLCINHSNILWEMYFKLIFWFPPKEMHRFQYTSVIAGAWRSWIFTKQYINNNWELQFSCFGSHSAPFAWNILFLIADGWNTPKPSGIPKEYTFVSSKLGKWFIFFKKCKIGISWKRFSLLQCDNHSYENSKRVSRCDSLAGEVTIR